jgi:hypothetical protein
MRENIFGWLTFGPSVCHVLLEVLCKSCIHPKKTPKRANYTYSGIPRRNVKHLHIKWELFPVTWYSPLTVHYVTMNILQFPQSYSFVWKKSLKILFSWIYETFVCFIHMDFNWKSDTGRTASWMFRYIYTKKSKLPNVNVGAGNYFLLLQNTSMFHFERNETPILISYYTSSTTTSSS